MDYKKLSGNKLRESSDAIRQCVQAARDIQNKSFFNNGSFDIVCKADMRIEEMRQLCRLQVERGVLTFVSLTCTPERTHRTGVRRKCRDDVACGASVAAHRVEVSKSDASSDIVLCIWRCA